MWSGEHLKYTLQLFKGTVERLVSGAYKHDWTVQMALVEVFTVESRSLFDFFYGSEPTNPYKYDDAVAVDFFDNTSIWEQKRKALLTPELDNLNARVAKETVHLTYSRRYGISDEKQWNWLAIYNDFSVVVKQFITAANQNALHENIRNFEPELFRG